MPGKKANKKTPTTPKVAVTPEVTGPKTEIAERIESQVGALVGSPATPDNRWFFQKVLPIGYGGRDAPTSAPSTVTPADPEPAAEEDEDEADETPADETPADETPADETPADEVEAPKKLSKAAKQRARQQQQKKEAAALELAKKEEAEKKQVVLRAALLTQMKATATEQLEKLKSSDEWTQRTERIAARYPDDKTKQTELTRSMSVNAWKQLRAEAVGATTLEDVKLVITKIEAMSEAVNKLEQGARFQVAKTELASAPPRAMTKPYEAPLDGDDHADPEINAQRQQHILHGDATGGKHAGEHARELPARGPALPPRAPDLATSGLVGGEFKSFFPPAWSEQDILDALKEAAAQTFDHRVAQPKEPWHQQRYKHPAWKVTLHRVPVNVVVITEDKKSGGYQVITGTPA